MSALKKDIRAILAYHLTELARDLLTTDALPMGSYPLGKCPRCGNKIHLWFQQNKATGGMLGKVSHTGTSSGRCHGRNGAKEDKP